MGQGILKCGHSTTGLDSCASWVVWRGPRVKPGDLGPLPSGRLGRHGGEG